MRPVIVARTWRGKLARHIAARRVITPAQLRRAAIIQKTSHTRPAALTGAIEIIRADPAHAAISADTQRVLWRPWARLANARLATLANAGAPATMATARLTSAGAATSENPTLTITPSSPPSSAPSVTAISALIWISRGISVRATKGSLFCLRDKIGGPWPVADGRLMDIAAARLERCPRPSIWYVKGESLFRRSKHEKIDAIHFHGAYRHGFACRVSDGRRQQ